MSEKNIVQNEVNNGDIDVISSPASTSTPGIAYFNPEDFTVDTDGYVSSRQKVGAIQYIGTITKEEDSSFVWNITKDISPKKLSDVKLNDLVLLAEDYGGYEAGLVFAVSALIYPELQTKKTAEFSIRGSVGDIGPQGVKGDTGATPNLTATASVTQNVGTASVNVSRSGSNENPNFDFKFDCIKGETGTTPNIIPSASVDQSIGTANVEVIRGGTDEDPTLDFEFTGIKGEVGETPDISATASVNQVIGTATVDVSKSGTKESPAFDFAFSGIKGETGDKGDKGDNLYVGMNIEEGILYLLSDSIMANDFILEGGCLYLEDE